MEEIWKPVLDYISLYEVSNFGRVRSIGGRNGCSKLNKILSPKKDRGGYFQVTFSKNGKKKYYLVHRLVYETFNGTIPDGMQVNHINEDKTDNRLENLNLMTPKENINWGTGIQRRATKESQQVLQLTPDGELVKEWNSMSDADKYGYNHSRIAACCNGKRKTYRGFKWMKKLPSC